MAACSSLENCSRPNLTKWSDEGVTDDLGLVAEELMSPMNY